jgi:hypothetical protein
VNGPITTPSGGWRRRLADVLVRHAARVLPASLGHWGQAMQNEFAYVPDGEALHWAAGCAAAAHATRLRRLHLLDSVIARSAGAVLMLFCAFDAAFPTMMTLAYRAGSRAVTSGLGRLTPGDDYQRLVPLMTAIPGWLHALAIAAAACHLLALVHLLRRRRSAHVPLLLGVALQLATRVLVQPFRTAAGVVVVENPSFLSSILLPIILPLTLACAAWSGSTEGSKA